MPEGETSRITIDTSLDGKSITYEILCDLEGDIYDLAGDYELGEF